MSAAAGPPARSARTTAGRVAVAGEIDEVEAELASELCRSAAAAYAGVVVDRDAVPEGEIEAHHLKELSTAQHGPAQAINLASIALGRR
jgi:hypothetical protein